MREAEDVGDEPRAVVVRQADVGWDGVGSEEGVGAEFGAEAESCLGKRREGGGGGEEGSDLLGDDGTVEKGLGVAAGGAVEEG